VVDDEEQIRFILDELLTSLGYGTVTKKNGHEAVAFYREKSGDIDAVIVDLAMPGMSGNECIRALKQINPCARIIISSGYNLVSDTQQIISKGIAGFIQKPFDIGELSRTISEVLANR
jgi:two-component system, cell cycle sensor histidine kinase and response regulator CckA